MSALSIQPTYPIFTDIDGQPLEDGYVWIGTANLDPQVNPINVYWDAALTVPAAQPIRTLAGYPSNSGTPARLYVNSDYSIRVMGKNGSVAYSAPQATERYSQAVVNSVNATNVIYDPPFIGGVQTNAQAKFLQAVNVKDFGVVGDGVADDTVAFQAALDAASSTNSTLFAEDVTMAITSVTIQDVSLETNNTTIKAISSAPLILLGSNVYQNGDLTLDLNSISLKGISGTAPDSVYLLGRITIKNAAIGGSNVNGGILFAGGTNIHLGDIFGINLSQTAFGTGLYRLVDFSNVTDGSFRTIDNTDGNLTCNLFASENISGDVIRSRNCRSNTCYIISDTQNININSIIHESGAGLGLTLDSTFADARVRVGFLSVNDCVNSLDLRRGGGYQIGTVSIYNGSMADNAVGVGVTGLQIGSFISVYAANAGTRPITLTRSTNVRIASGVIHCSFLPTGSRPIDLSGTADGFTFGGSITASVSMPVLASITVSTAVPDIQIDVSTNQSAPRITATSITDYTLSLLRVNGSVLSGSAEIVSVGTIVPTFTFLSLDQSLALDQVIGEVKAVSSDTSSPGTKFALRTRSTNATGTTFKTELFDDANNLVAIVNNSALAGMSIVLPTSATGLPSGAIWNNSGSIAIVP